MTIDPSIASAAISAAGGITGALTQTAANVFLSDRANDQSMKNWQTKTDYDNPTNQMTRLRDAGLNPNLVYGKGTMANTSAPMPSMYKAEAENPTGHLSDIQQVVNTELQSSQIKAQTEAALAQARSANASAASQEHDNNITAGTPIPNNEHGIESWLAKMFAGAGKVKLNQDTVENVMPPPPDDTNPKDYTNMRSALHNSILHGRNK